MFCGARASIFCRILYRVGWNGILGCHVTMISQQTTQRRAIMPLCHGVNGVSDLFDMLIYPKTDFPQSSTNLRLAVQNIHPDSRPDARPSYQWSNTHSHRNMDMGLASALCVIMARGGQIVPRLHQTRRNRIFTNMDFACFRS